MARPVIVVNPNSAGGKTRRAWPALEAEIRAALRDPHVLFTERPGHATELARSALRRGADLVIAMGGDGTTHEVVNGFFDGTEPVRPGAAFAVLPAGTGGDFLRTTGTPRSPREAARAIALAAPRSIDAARLTYTTRDGQTALRHFVNVASFGVGGLVDSYVNRSAKRLGGKLTFLLASLHATLVYENQRCRVRCDGGPPEERRVYSMAIANGRYFGGGMMIAPDAQLDDGRFDVVDLGDVSLFTLLRHNQKIYRGTHVRLPHVTVRRAARVFAEPVDPGADVLLDVDGEGEGKLPATFEILPGALRFAG